MAGRYVILKFEDKTQAEDFVSNRKKHTKKGYNVEAVYLKPSKFCSCPDKARQDARNWLKHPKYGLYTCRTCKLPSTHHESGILSRLQYVFGYSIEEGK